MTEKEDPRIGMINDYARKFNDLMEVAERKERITVVSDLDPETPDSLLYINVAIGESCIWRWKYRLQNNNGQVFNEKRLCLQKACVEFVDKMVFYGIQHALEIEQKLLADHNKNRLADPDKVFSTAPAEDSSTI